MRDSPGADGGAGGFDPDHGRGLRPGHWRDGGGMRVVSLVPSLTEAVTATVPDVLIGATDYCTHRAGLDVARVGGSKYLTSIGSGRCGPIWCC